MPKKKFADKEPVVMDGAMAASSAQAQLTKARAPRASASAVTHKHKKTTIAVPTVEPTAVVIAAPVAEPTYEQIAKKAYSYWEARGYQSGSQEDDWYRAVTELRSR